MSVPPQPPTQPGWPPHAPVAGWPQQPPQAAWPQQPPQAAWPHPPVVATRIPDDQPFTVRHSPRKRALQFGVLLLFVALVVGCPLGLVAAESAGSVPSVVLVVVLLLAFCGALFALQIYLLTSGGPALAVGPAGLWIKTRPTRGQAIWLPWEAVEQIYRRRWGLDKMVCVKPRDPRVSGHLGAFTAIESGMQQLFFGTGFTAPLTFADRPEQEIMGAIAHFSAGRCPVR